MKTSVWITCAFMFIPQHCYNPNEKKHYVPKKRFLQANIWLTPKKLLLIK